MARQIEFVSVEHLWTCVFVSDLQHNYCMMIVKHKTNKSYKTNFFNQDVYPFIFQWRVEWC